ncbi:MAG: type II toxin-antitoxin system VapC family toxin [Acidobacteria bacterium]|nr:type II toxin-antitoxin system VapC family toxin [Acidobacteriota bacterium]
MVPLVLDASAAINIVLRSDRAGWLSSKLESSATVSVPDLFCPEVANTLWKYVRSGLLSREDALERYETAVRLADHFFSTEELTVEALAEGIQHSHAIYDLTYAVLARRTGSSVLTADRSFARLLEKMNVPVLLAP